MDGRARTGMKAKTTVKLNSSLCDRARQIVERTGYSSLEEFIEHAMERDLARLETSESKEELMRKLKGLGYLK
jgi:Arc/MetJ-type ribon-helix-helix transcriptional regulator